MARPISLLAVFFISFNLFAGMLLGTGTAALIGIDGNVGGDQAVNERVEQSENISSGTPLGSTLFGMYNVLAGGVSTLVGIAFPGLNMLERAGVPGYITGNFLAPLFSIVIGIGIISFLRGWGL